MHPMKAAHPRSVQTAIVEGGPPSSRPRDGARCRRGSKFCAIVVLLATVLAPAAARAAASAWVGDERGSARLITAAQATQWIADANRIRAVIGCGTR